MIRKSGALSRPNLGLLLKLTTHTNYGNTSRKCLKVDVLTKYSRKRSNVQELKIKLITNPNPIEHRPPARKNTSWI